MKEAWRRSGGVEEEWERIGGGVEEEWKRIGGGGVEEGMYGAE